TGGDTSWEESLQMLEKGEVDLITFASKTEERLKLFDYSENPIGTGSYILTVREGDTRYESGDAASYNGMRVGFVSGTSHYDALTLFAKQKGFWFTPVYFDTLEEMLSALQSGGQIDATVSSSLRSRTSEIVLEELNPVDFYVIVKKGNVKLMAEINRSMAQMDMDSPGWRLTLKNRYYSSVSPTISLTKTERAYLEACAEQGKVFQVVTNPDLAPYSSCENGQVSGIAPDVFREIAGQLGLQYEFVPFDTYAEYNAFIRGGGGDIDLTCFSSYGLAELHGLDLSNAYLSTTMALVMRANFGGEMQSLAVLDLSDNNTTYSHQLAGVLNCQTYATNAECLRAVIDGRADGVYLYAYTAQKAVTEDVQNRLQYSILPEYSVDLAIGVRNSLDYRLMAVLNKGIASMRGSAMQRVTQEHLSQIKESASLLSWIYDYPVPALVILCGVLALVFLAVMFAVTSRNTRRQRQQAQEVARFMGYVCETNEAVMEVNLDTLQCSTHKMENGALVSREMPYEFAHANNFNSVIHPEDFKRLTTELSVKSFWDIFEDQGKYTYFEARAKAPDGTYQWYAYTIRAIPRDAEHPHNFILFKRNIDEVKKKEEEQRQVLEDALENARVASAAKGQFLSRMSHEIRTPLNAIIGYMDMARDAAQNPARMMHCVENSDLAARHLLSIINDVLDISSIESGKMKIAHEEFDLKKQLTTIATLFFHQAQEKKVQFDIKLQSVSEEWVIGDGLRLNQILMNLLSNAIKFTPENGRINLNVSQVSSTDENVFMKFEVSDTGIGMSEEYQKRLFKPFEQESATTAQKYGGTGLGLSITYNLVQMMGGSIEVSSRQGDGTTFVVSLHFGRSHTAHAQAARQDYSRVRALIVDDDGGSREYMRELLKRCKVKCDAVAGGEEALQQLRRRMGTEYGYDLCILDWNMPEMNGVELARQIRAEFKADLPIIIATAYDIAEVEETAREAGVDRVIAKPLFQSTMFDLLVSTYGGYEPVQAAQPQPEALRGLRVLLAEDNAMNMEIAVNVLEKAGISVDQATDGQQAVDRFMAEPPDTYDAILMDVQMPVLDGYQATRKIRASSHPRAASVPIIAMTANAFAEDVNAALANGMNDHVSKPIDHEKLFAVLGRVAKNREAEKHEAT
ncbi:MAG: response regulator, partial [Eubacteriales bacterium]|nr:response regulator [Eubacteriales bacterium]